jgi:hypothetical protein
MQHGTRHPILEHLDAFVGQWETEATHRLMPDLVVRGTASFEWLEGGRYLILRARNEHPDFPDSISILGCDEPDGADDTGAAGGGCSLRYFDSRGIFRHMALEAEPGVLRFWRDRPGFSQRFTGTLGADGNTITGLAELCQDGTTWEKDLWITYKRVK